MDTDVDEDVLIQKLARIGIACLTDMFCENHEQNEILEMCMERGWLTETVGPDEVYYRMTEAGADAVLEDMGIDPS